MCDNSMLAPTSKLEISYLFEDNATSLFVVTFMTKYYVAK